MMEFNWEPYCSTDASLVDSWLDEYAIHETGLENGWQSFFDYWMSENRSGEGKDRCFLISQKNIPFAVIYLAVTCGEVIISEYVVAPHMRGRGYGTAAIKDLLAHTHQLVHEDIRVAKAVIFPGNTASVRAFEKAGFQLVVRHQDHFGDSLHYEFMLDEDPQKTGMAHL